MRSLVLSLLVATLSVPVYAAARLTYPINGTPTAVYWPSSAFPIPYAIDRRVVDSAPGVKEVIDRAFAAWADVAEATISFKDTGVASNARAGFNDTNTVSFADDLFKDQKCLALTTNWYDTTSGRLTDVDIQIDPSLMNSSYNVQQAIEHEIGHLLGLDHSAVLSSVMYPYVTPADTSVVLDSDDRIGVAGIYPKTSRELAGGTFTGKVIGDSGGIFAAQVVAVNERGEPVATALSNAAGEFELQGLPPGNYRIYAEPLDGPVDAHNLAGIWRLAEVVSFPTTRFADSPPMHIETGRVYGNLMVSGVGTPVRLNPKWIGASPVGSSDVNLGTTVVQLRPGETVSLAVGGDGFTSGMTKFEVLNPAFQRTSDFSYSGNFVSANFTVASTATPQSAVVLVTSGNDTATLTGALRVTGTGPSRTRVARR